MQNILSAVVVFSIILLSTYYLYTTYYLKAGSSIVRLKRDYENAYVQIIGGGGKVCSPGELAFAVYVKWDEKERKFVKMCVYPTNEEVSTEPISNNVVIVPGGG